MTIYLFMPLFPISIFFSNFLIFFRLLFLLSQHINKYKERKRNTLIFWNCFIIILLLFTKYTAAAELVSTMDRMNERGQILADIALERPTSQGIEVELGGEESDPVRCSPVSGDAEVCGVCLEEPTEGNCVLCWCCGNILCVPDAQQLGKCPFCRQEPLVWSITK